MDEMGLSWALSPALSVNETAGLQEHVESIVAGYSTLDGTWQATAVVAVASKPLNLH
jgi:hypothetical protein